MGFAAPWIWLLAAGVAIPLWVHLARRPHDTGRAVASLMFLKRHDVKQTRARTLRDRGLLLARVLLLLALIAALAQPFVERTAEVSTGPQAVVVVLDQSASMLAEGRQTQAVAAFDEVTAGLGSTGTPVALIGATASSRQLLDFTVDRAALRATFAAATPMPVKGRLRPALQHAVDLFAEAGFGNGRIVLISDLQRSAMPLTEGPLAIGAHTLHVKAVGQRVPANLSLASIQWQPDAGRVAVRAEHTGGSDGAGAAAHTLKVHVDGHVVLDQSLELAAGESRTEHVNVTTAADRAVEVTASIDDTAFTYDNRAGLVIDADRALRYSSGPAAQTPSQIVAALASFRSPRMLRHESTTSQGAVADLLIVTAAGQSGDQAGFEAAGTTGVAVSAGARAVLAFGAQRQGPMSASGDPSIATLDARASPLGHIDVNTLTPELSALGAALAALDIPGPQALQVQDGDAVLMRWASGEAAAILRITDARRVLSVGIPSGASLDALARTAVFAPLLREWILRVLATHAAATSYAAGELIMRGTDNAAGGAVLLAPDGKQTRWGRASPLYAPLIPGRYELIDEHDEQQVRRFWVRHDSAEARLASMTPETFLARVERAPEVSDNTASLQAHAPTRVAWWRFALGLALLVAMFELWLATRAASLEEGVN